MRSNPNLTARATSCCLCCSKVTESEQRIPCCCPSPLTLLTHSHTWERQLLKNLYPLSVKYFLDKNIQHSLIFVCDVFSFSVKTHYLIFLTEESDSRVRVYLSNLFSFSDIKQKLRGSSQNLSATFDQSHLHPPAPAYPCTSPANTSAPASTTGFL